MPISRQTTQPATAGSSGPAAGDQRIAFVQFGDFLHSAQSFARGGLETYYAQRYSVELVEALRETYAGVMVLCVDTGPYDEELPSGIRCMAFRGGIWGADGHRRLLERLRSWGPTTVVARTPSRSLIAQSIKVGWRVLPLLADSFLGAGLKARFAHWRLARLLNHPQIDLVGNHQVPASRDLVRLGVNPAKVVPWDWPSMSRPGDFPAKSGIGAAGVVNVMYAGAIVEDKGVGDLLSAIAKLKGMNLTARATIAGRGEVDHFQHLADSLGILDRVHFAGLVPHARIVPMMHEHDAVVVPSRHAYSEGLPMTIYDALTSRSPLVVSDHPMFLKRLEADRTCLVFPERDAGALAGCLRRLADEPDLYARLSLASEAAWDRLRIPVGWGEFLKRWLAGQPEDLQWLLRHSLARYVYD